MTAVHETPHAVDRRTGADGEPKVGRRRRVPRSIKVVIALVALLLVYGAVTFVQVWGASREDHARRAQALVVLGAAQYDGRPSPVLRARLDHALVLYRSSISPLVVVTGGRRTGDRFTEATAGYRYLRRRGVPDGAILKEVHGRTTFESLAAVSRILRPRGVHTVVLVSDAFHAKRVGDVARQLGLDARVSPAGHSARLGSLLRETAAVGVGRLVGYRRLDRFDR